MGQVPRLSQKCFPQMLTLTRTLPAPVFRWGMLVLPALLALEVSAQTVDVAAAERLARKSHCTKCHAAAKERTGPALKTIAEKYRGRGDAVEVLVQHITTGPRIVIDGEEETHKRVQSHDEAEILNLVRYILSH